MPPSMTAHFGLRIAAILIAWSPISNVGAETKLTDFRGAWHGKGTDRNLPFQHAQRTNCRMWVLADQSQMTSSTTCRGDLGLSKVFRLNIALDGDHFTGSASQTSVARGSTATVTGSVTGRKTNEMATFQVRFPGFTPNAEVVLKLIGKSSFSMQIASHGFTLSDLIFHRPGAQ